MKKKRKNNKFKLLLVLLVLGISIGFAILTTALRINGIGRINKATWNIHWENVQVENGSVTATVPAHIVDADRTIVEYSIVLEKPGDFYEFSVDAKNDGTIDGMITGISNDLYSGNTLLEGIPPYLSYKITYSDGKDVELNHMLKVGRKESYKIKVMFKETVSEEDLPSTDQALDFKFNVTYQQSNNSAYIRDNECSIAMYEEGTLTPSRYLDKCETYIDDSIYTYTTNQDDTITITGFKSGYTIQQVKSTVRDLKASKLVNDKELKVRKVDNHVISFKNGIWAIPAEIDGKEVSKISGDAFSEVAVNTTLILPPTLTEIEDGWYENDDTYGAFYNAGLDGVVLPNSLVKIGKYAFTDNNLTSLVIPDSVTTIGFAGFMANTIEDLKIGDGLLALRSSDTMFDYSKVKKLDTGDGVKTISIGYTPELTNLTIGNSVNTIADGSFSLARITKIILPDSVKVVDSMAFSGCNLVEEIYTGNGLVELTGNAFSSITVDEDVTYRTVDSLRKIVIGDSVETITNGAFSGASLLTEIKFGKNVKTITNGAFYGASSLTKLVLPDSVETVNYSAFSSSGIKYFDTGNGLTEVDSTAYGGMPLEKLVIGDSIQRIQGGVFSGKTNLTSVTWGKSLKTIDSYAFAGSGLTTLDLTNTNIEYINSGAFTSGNLYTVKLPDTLRDIGSEAFKDNNISTLDLGNSVQYIYSDAFRGNNIEGTLTIPSSVLMIDDDAFAGNLITRVNLSEGITYLSGFGMNQISSLNIPASVTDIGYGAFSRNAISTLTIPATVQYIYNNAFDFNGMDNLYLNEGLLKIYQDAFRNNDLTTIRIPDSVQFIGVTAFSANRVEGDDAFIFKRENGVTDDSVLSSYAGLGGEVSLPYSVTTLGESVFYATGITSLSNYSQLTEIEEHAFGATGITSFTVPSGVTSIPVNAFWASSLSSITMHNNVTSIGDGAFGYCRLQSLTIPSGVTSIGSGAIIIDGGSNSSLTTISNKTGRSFDWNEIITYESSDPFVTGTVQTEIGTVTITN